MNVNIPYRNWRWNASKIAKKETGSYPSKNDRNWCSFIRMVDELWLTLIDECLAHVNKTITFKFKNGYSITK